LADIQALRGVRFNRRVAGPVGPLLAPPYDVAAEFTDGGEFGIRNIEASDLGAGSGNHALAARRYQAWLKNDVIRADPKPAIYIHRHRFLLQGVPVERTGIIARVRLADWSERVVLPHERTTTGPREERLHRLRAVEANLSPLYLLFRDPTGEIRDLMAAVDANPELDDHDQMGGAHRLTAASHVTIHDRLASLVAERTLFVADGHHRYEAALIHRDECRNTRTADRDSPSEFVLALLAAVEDPGVIVRPTHRLVTGGAANTPDAIMRMLRRWFDLRPADVTTPAVDTDLVGRVVLPRRLGTWDIFAQRGRPHLGLLPLDRGPAWLSLGVTAIEGAVNRVFSADSEEVAQHLFPVVEEANAVRDVEAGRAAAAFLLPAPTLDRLLAVAEEGDLLPPKSTWFDPKAPAGLVISDLRL